MPIRHARAPHRAFPRRRSHRTGPTRGGARRHDGFPLPTRSTPSSVTSRNALCENAIGLNEPGRVCHRGSTAGRWKPAPIRCTVQACALVAGLRRPLGHGKLHPYCFERQHGGYRRVALCALICSGLPGIDPFVCWIIMPVKSLRFLNVGSRSANNRWLISPVQCRGFVNRGVESACLL